MKRLFLILLLILLPSYVYANAYVSQQDGNWSRASNNADSPWFDGGVQSGWASFPQAADTVTIAVGHTVTVDGNITVGNNAANDTTYNIDIIGNLVWPQSPAGNWTFRATSTIRLNGTGKFYIGCTPAAPTTRLNCANYAIVDFQTGAAIKYDIRIDGAHAQLIARGCEGFNTSAGTETRARISSCNPDCTAGVRTLTLDRTVNWITNPAITNPVTAAGTGNAEVILGTGGHASAAALGVNQEIAEITATPAANQITLTLANAHQVGDMVVNPTRNILIRSSSAANHGSIYAEQANIVDPYMVSWVRLDEMGDGATYNTAAIGRDAGAVANSLGTIDYTFVTNCDDGLAAFCWYLEGDWDTFEYNGIYDVNVNGRGFYFNTNNRSKTLEGLTAIAGGACGIYGNTTYDGIHYDKCWFSSGTELLAGNILSIKDSLFHQATGYLLNNVQGDTWERRIPVDIQNNEFRNSTANTCVMFYAYNGIFINNDWDNCYYKCLAIQEGGNVQIYMETNIFDSCNLANNIGHAALYVNAETGTLYSQGDVYGATNLNNNANIMFYSQSPASYTNQINERLIFNETILNGPANPIWAYPMYGTNWLGGNGWWYRQYFGNESFATLHSEDGIEGAHWGFGPGGMIIERVTGAGPTGGWIDNTLNLKIIPYAADVYNHVPLGKVHVNNGTVLTITMKIQKNQAIANGRRPRLVLKGCGFNPVVDYDEMADVNNAWDTVTVSGTANAKGAVHINIEVLNDLLGDVTYPLKPIDPPTIIIYADGIDYSKS